MNPFKINGIDISSVRERELISRPSAAKRYYGGCGRLDAQLQRVKLILFIQKGEGMTHDVKLKLVEPQGLEGLAEIVDVLPEAEAIRDIEAKMLDALVSAGKGFDHWANIREKFDEKGYNISIANPAFIDCLKSTQEACAKLTEALTVMGEGHINAYKFGKAMGLTKVVPEGAVPEDRP